MFNFFQKCRLNLLKIFKIAKKSGKQNIGEEKSHIFENVYVLKTSKVDLRHKYNAKIGSWKRKGLFIKTFVSVYRICDLNTIFTPNLRK